MNTDRHGMPISTDIDHAADRYREGMALTFAAWPGGAEALDAAIEADPEFALPCAARARHYAMASEPGKAREFMEKAIRLVAQRGDERERSHVDTLALLMAGRTKESLAKALAHAEQWPRDALILSLPLGAFGLFAFSGMRDHDQARVDLCEKHASHFGDDDWWFLTAYGWALAEDGSVSRGRAMLEKAFELRRQSANTVHALTHAMFEGGAGGDAEKLITGWLPDYDRSGILHGHIAWHAALVALERGDPNEAFQTYLDHVHPSVSQGMPINIVSDAASLLWRMDAYGHGAPEGRWQEIAEYARTAFPRPGHAFVDAHMAMIEAATGAHADLSERVAVLETMAASGALGAGDVVPAIGRASLAFAEGDYARCVSILEPFAADVARIGGSGAQREVIEDTLLVALMRSGEAAKAKALLDERLHRRPSPRDARWKSQLPQAD
ncbi:tetratricopeptide repeat protein [Phenylobacterium sp.]|uniref:tetratricopeptide repeat protein n=1 Tax=Phenylobacterium sp. TaxID=1871053 RepID=UPI00301CEC8C